MTHWAAQNRKEARENIRLDHLRRIYAAILKYNTSMLEVVSTMMDPELKRLYILILKDGY